MISNENEEKDEDILEQLEPLQIKESLPGIDQTEDLRERSDAEIISDKQEGGMRVTRLLVGGVEVEVLEDKLGHVWNVPADGTIDYSSANRGTVIDKAIPHFNPHFHYELHHRNKVPEKLLEGFVIVTKQEVKLPDDLVMEYGKPVSSEMALVDAVLMKIPKKISDRRYAAKHLEVQEALDQVKPTEEMLERARQKGAPIMKSLREMQKAARAKSGVAPIRQEVSRHVSSKITE